MSKIFEISNMREAACALAEIKRVLDKGRLVKLEVKSKSSKTKEQMGYYWEVILPRVQLKFKEDGTLISLLDLNKFFNEMFFSNEEIFSYTKKSGEQGAIAIREVRSKSGATIEQMSAYIDAVLRWCAEEGIYIPEPDQNYKTKYHMDRICQNTVSKNA